ncbi:MAG TPA: aminoglycoside phosphotransferase family protein [Anaerolineaceae bacterium]|nr:aminoglycoside phosphotransferase family protein [Anaerolineaceae bacterium]
MNSIDLSPYISQFLGDVHFQSKAIVDGHIHDGWYIQSNHPKYPETILQKINTHVFPDPAGLIENIHHITQYLRQQNPSQKQLELVPTISAHTSYQASDGSVWRMYEWIKNGYTTQITKNLEQVREAGRITGEFLRLLKDYPVHSLHIPIPDFHNTPIRYHDFLNSLSVADPVLLTEIQPEIEFLHKRAQKFGLFWDALNDGRIPWRVTHNDTKLDNILFDLETHQAICLIDLDTIMPGCALFDFGDALRAMGNPVTEDESDLSKVVFQLPVFEAYTQGYLSAARGILSPLEIAWLAFSPWLITIEIGMRFLTDYLQNNHYFRIHYPKQNLNRCRTQFKLATDMESRLPEMEAIVMQTQQ